MGIYILTGLAYAAYGKAIIQKEGRNGDFGKHVIHLTWKVATMYCLSFQAMERTWGTIDSLWEQYGIYRSTVELGIRDKKWQVFSKNPDYCSSLISFYRNRSRKKFVDHGMVCYVS